MQLHMYDFRNYVFKTLCKIFSKLKNNNNNKKNSFQNDFQTTCTN